VDTVLELLRREARPLDVAAIKRRLAALGIADVDGVWASVGPVLRAHADVVYASKRYGVAAVEPAAPEVTVAEALAQLGTELPEAQRTALVALIQAELDAMRAVAAEADALRAQALEVNSLRQRLVELEREISQQRTPPAAPPPEPPAAGQSHAEYERAERRRQARERNARIEAMTKVADLAAEVEELVAKRATKEVLLESTRALVSVSGLQQIGTGGERTDYDESLHEPVGDTPGAGGPVIVVRPGYRWKAPGEVVLISRAQVRRV
jgi:hypothetical protein